MTFSPPKYFMYLENNSTFCTQLKAFPPEIILWPALTACFSKSLNALFLLGYYLEAIALMACLYMFIQVDFEFTVLGIVMNIHSLVNKQMFKYL